MSAHAEQENDLPPPYTSESSLPNQSYLDLSLDPVYLTSQPISFLVRGDYRSPDLTVVAPDGRVAFNVQTDSTAVFHENSIYDAHISRRLFGIKRKGHGDDEIYFYTAALPGKDGKKLLEISTRPKLLDKGGSTRLVFRNGRDAELDALDLKLSPRATDMQVLHRGTVAGSIQRNSKARNPEFVLNVPAGMDPVLLLVLAVVVDDRLMTTRRRYRRPFHSGWRGIGKGPGAGLAGGFAIAGLI